MYDLLSVTLEIARLSFGNGLLAFGKLGRHRWMSLLNIDINTGSMQCLVDGTTYLGAHGRFPGSRSAKFITICQVGKPSWPVRLHRP